jgi:hypothetical protein
MQDEQRCSYMVGRGEMLDDLHLPGCMDAGRSLTSGGRVAAVKPSPLTSRERQ